MTLYKVIINLPGGKRVEAVKASLPLALEMVEAFHAVHEGYIIDKIDTEGSRGDGGGQVDQDRH